MSNNNNDGSTNGDDTLIGTDGNDHITGAGGNDTIEGGGGDDVLAGNRGDDFITGGEGNDILRGGKGFDTLNGEAGNDRIRAGEDGALMSGGAGADTFVVTDSFGLHIITDFNPNEDVLRLVNINGINTFADFIATFESNTAIFQDLGSVAFFPFGGLTSLDQLNETNVQIVSDEVI